MDEDDDPGVDGAERANAAHDAVLQAQVDAGHRLAARAARRWMRLCETRADVLHAVRDEAARTATASEIYYGWGLVDLQPCAGAPIVDLVAIEQALQDWAKDHLQGCG